MHALIDETTTSDENAMRKVLQEQNFQSDNPHRLILSTAGIAEDALTIYINGVLDSGRMVRIDLMGFLHVDDATKISKTQRKGRAGRVAHSLWCCFTEKVSEDAMQLTYAESMQTTLAATLFGVP